MIDEACGVTPEMRDGWAEDRRRNNEAYALCIEGLLTDGAHHKQWFLEKIAETLGGDLNVVRKFLHANDYEWESGTAP